MRKNTIKLYARPSVELEHIRFEQLVNAEDALRDLDPEEFIRYEANQAAHKKQFTQARAQIKLVPLSQRLMIQTAANLIHPHGRYKVFDCVTCMV